jgi:hypothetical protein
VAFRVRQIPLAQLRPAEWNANVVPPATLNKIRASPALEVRALRSR